MMNPRFWKQLERHPLSGEYPDLTREQRDRMRQAIRDYGVLNDRAVIVFEGKVLDGWQLYRACVDENVTPTFQTLPEVISAEEYVSIMNDCRRHEDHATTKARAEARRKRVVAARQEGQSIRGIAEQEGVSKSQIERDLQSSGVPTGHLESGKTEESAKTTGRDGKQYPASRPVNPDLCDRCNRIGSAVCNDCRRRIAAKNAATARTTEPPPQREPGDDSEAIAEELRANREARARNGKPLFDWKAFYSHLGYVVRANDEIGRAFPGEASSDEYLEMEDLMTKVCKTFSRWEKRLKREAQ